MSATSRVTNGSSLPKPEGIPGMWNLTEQSLASLDNLPPL